MQPRYRRPLVGGGQLGTGTLLAHSERGGGRSVPHSDAGGGAGAAGAPPPPTPAAQRIPSGGSVPPPRQAIALVTLHGLEEGPVRPKFERVSRRLVDAWCDWFPGARDVVLEVRVAR